MEVESVLVTGANRGIGLEFVRQLVRLPNPPKYVFATYRNKDGNKVLKEIRDSSQTSQIVLIQMDIRKPDHLKEARRIIEATLADKGLTLLINNAGAARSMFFPEVTEEDIQFHLATNAVGPLMVLKEMFPLLQKAASRKEAGMNVSRAAVLNISSEGGSCGRLDPSQDRQWFGYLSYEASKAALNMAMRVVAFTVKEKGILVVQMCPGWVKTDSGGENAPLTPEESISCMLDTLSRLDETHTGAFLNRKGDTIPF